MANLRQLVRDYRYEIDNGIAWVAVYKNGRSWEAKAFYPEAGDYENGYVFSKDDYDEMLAISKVDGKAVCFNGDYAGGFEDFTLEEIENKILYFREARLNQLNGDFLGALVVPLEMHVEERNMEVFNITYGRNNVLQTILVEGVSANEAGRYFMNQNPDADFYGIRVANAGDMRPGKPLMKVPEDFAKNVEAVLERYGLDKPSGVSFHYQMLDRLRSDCAYYLGNGDRYAGHLWVNGDEKGHIELMKALWDSFPADGKPEWLPYDKILWYEKEMVGPAREHKFEIELVIDVEKANGDPLEVKLMGDDLVGLKADILPTVRDVCAEDGYLDGEVFVEVNITRNGEYFDRDEDVFDLGELNERFVQIGEHRCQRVDSWMNEEASYILGNSLRDSSFYFAVVNSCTVFEYDSKPSREKVESDYADYEAARAFDRYEAEFGADGRRAFPHLNDDVMGDKSVDEVLADAAQRSSVGESEKRQAEHDKGKAESAEREGKESYR